MSSIITQLNSLEHDTTNGYYNSAVQIDSTHFMLAYQTGSGYAAIKTFSVDSNYDITEIDELVHDNVATAAKEMSLIKIDATHFMLAYAGVDADGFIKTFSIDGSYDNITEIDVLEHDTSDGRQNSLVQIDSTHYILAYSSTSLVGVIKTFSIDGSYDNITELQSLEHDSVRVQNNSFVKIDATHYMLAYNENATYDAWVKTFSIDGSYTITEIDALEHETSVPDAQQSLVQIDSTHCILAYSGASDDGYLKIFTLDVSYNITQTTNFEHNVTNTYYSSLVAIDSTNFMLAYRDADGDGIVKTFSIDGSYAFTQTYNLEYDIADSSYNSLIQLDTTHYAVAYAGVDNDGFIKTFYVSQAVSESPSISPSTSPSQSISPSTSPSQSISPSISPSPSASASWSPSPSTSLSPSTSISPSISPSYSPSTSISPSISESISASISPSESPSTSISPSISTSVSPSASLSPSISESLSPSISSSISPSTSPSTSISPSISPSPSPEYSGKKLIYKIYQEDDTFISVLTDVISDFSITRQINGGDNEFVFRLNRKLDDFDEGTEIAFNHRVRVYLQDEYNPTGDKLVAYGYIVSYSPFLRYGDEGLEVTCLSAVSKLTNDFYRSGTSLDASDLGVELTSVRADEMMEAIITHYRSVETNSMISSDFSNADATTDNAGAAIDFTQRFFNMKHLDALRESSKFLAKNKEGGYWWYWRIATDGKLWVKKISTTADHSFKVGNEITEISGSKTIEDVINRVYFWNEKGTVDPAYLNLTNDDATSQTAYDVMASYITDSKITNPAAAGLLTESKVYDYKDPKVRMRITLNSKCDLSAINPGDTCTIRNVKNNPFKVGSDDILLINSITYKVDTATIEISNVHVDFEDIVENERQRLDKEMTWFGYITQQLTAAQLGPADRTWASTLVFSATSGGDAYRKVDWSAGIVYIPTSTGSASGKRVIVAGTTGNMTAATDYYIYLDEGTLNTTAATVESGAAGIVVKGGTELWDASKSWTPDQYQGYILTIGGQTKIIKSNTTTLLVIEGNWSVETTGAYTIKKMTLESTDDKTTIAAITKVIFSNVKANAITTSQAIIVPVRDSNINIDGSTQIAERSLSADRIIANSITANEINTGAINIGDWGGDLDDISDGSTYNRTTTNQVTGAGRAYLGLDTSNRIVVGFNNANLSSVALPTNGVRIDANGIYGRKSGANTFYIDTTGDAYFTGTIAASAVTGSTITGGTVQTASGTGQRIVMHSDNTLKYYNSSNILRLQMSGTNGLNFYNTAGALLGYLTGTTTSILSLTASATNASLHIVATGSGNAVLAIGSSAYFYASGSTSTNVSAKTLQMGTESFLNLGKMTGAEAAALTSVDGSMYYRTDDDVIRVKLNGTWETILTT